MVAKRFYPRFLDRLLRLILVGQPSGEDRGSTRQESTAAHDRSEKYYTGQPGTGI